MPQVSRRRTAARKADKPDFDIVEAARQFRVAQVTAKTAHSLAERIKKQIKPWLQEHGTPDEKGSLWFRFGTAVEDLAALKLERRVTQVVLLDKAEKLLRDKGLYDEAIETTVVIDAERVHDVIAALRKAGLDEAITVHERIDDDRLWALYADKKLTERQMTSILHDDESWALVPKPVGMGEDAAETDV